MNFQEKTISSETIFEGHIIKLLLQKVELPNGKQASREFLRHPGGVAILPVDADGNAYLVRQFRKPYDDMVLEAPAGKLSPGEEHRHCGERELEEETGYTAKHITYLGHILPSPGYTDELIHLYLAQDLTLCQQNLDEDEFLNVETYPFEEIVEMCIDGRISDAKTVALVLRAKERM